MKRLFIIILFSIFYQHIQAQNSVNYDREKLLEYYQSQRYADAAQYLQTIYPENTQDSRALNQIAYCYMMADKLAETEKKQIDYTKSRIAFLTNSSLPSTSPRTSQ